MRKVKYSFQRKREENETCKTIKITKRLYEYRMYLYHNATATRIIETTVPLVSMLIFKYESP